MLSLYLQRVILLENCPKSAQNSIFKGLKCQEKLLNNFHSCVCCFSWQDVYVVQILSNFDKYYKCRVVTCPVSVSEKKKKKWSKMLKKVNQIAQLISLKSTKTLELLFQSFYAKNTKCLGYYIKYIGFMGKNLSARGTKLGKWPN